MKVRSMSGIVVALVLLLLNASTCTAEWDLEAALSARGQPKEVVRQLQSVSVLVTERRAARDRRGVKILLAGPRDVAKVKAAQIIAGKQGMTLYQVDLASVVSKYLGETEKNLNRILSRAQESNMILFFDEADALFGKRTGVGDDHDRFTNQNIEYILQRIEAYQGILILASNMKQQLTNIRIDVRVVLESSPSFHRMTTTNRKPVSGSM